jgi:hypothetical protein
MPNQFVNQGYVTFDPASLQYQQQQQMRQFYQQQQQQPKMYPQMAPQPSGTRIIPIQLEGGGVMRGPLSQSPTVIQR